jgi:predicted O-methyltransferase YrrM
MTHDAHSIAEWLGYLKREEVDLLTLLAGKVNSDTPIFVNIGAGAGTSSFAMLEGNPKAVVFSVDMRTTEDEISTSEHLRLQEIDPSVAIRVIKIWGNSHNVGKSWPFPIDMLFVDGDHSEQGCYDDLADFGKWVKPGGFIAVHDYQKSVWEKDVSKATDRYALEHNLGTVALVKSIVAFKV